MFKKPFFQMDKTWQLEKCTIPQAVFVTNDPDKETTEQIIKRQEKFLNLSEEIKTKLASYKTSEKIQQIGKTFNLELLQMASISRAIRNYYFEEVNLKDFSNIFQEEMRIDNITAQEISKTVIQQIIDDHSAEMEYRSQLDNLPLIQALEEYPELGEQLITSNRVQLKNFPEPVRPSTKNWLADYTFNLGNRKHNSMERNNYAFHGTNARNINAYDRQKLTYILRSFDEDSPVFVNKNTKQVVFDKENTSPERKISSTISNFQFPISNKNPNAQIANSPPIASTRIQEKTLNHDSDLKFSFPQKLPYETMQLKQSAPPIAKKLNPIVRIPKEEKKDERILGKNVVNLRE